MSQEVERDGCNESKGEEPKESRVSGGIRVSYVKVRWVKYGAYRAPGLKRH